MSKENQKIHVIKNNNRENIENISIINYALGAGGATILRPFTGF